MRYSGPHDELCIRWRFSLAQSAFTLQGSIYILLALDAAIVTFVGAASIWRDTDSFYQRQKFWPPHPHALSRDHSPKQGRKTLLVWCLPIHLRQSRPTTGLLVDANMIRSIAFALHFHIDPSYPGDGVMVREGTKRSELVFHGNRLELGNGTPPHITTHENIRISDEEYALGMGGVVTAVANVFWGVSRNECITT